MEVPMRPADLKYTKTHEWVRVEDSEAVFGITDYAVEHLSDLTFLDLPDIGDELKRGESFGEIESVKAVAELNAPLTGIVTAVNTDIQDNLEGLSEDPFGEGWLVRIQMADAAELDGLLPPADYEKAVEAEEE
jgi:glycine cleavage system H protein